MASFHADFMSAPDPAKVMELLGSMSEKDREAIMKQATERMGDLFGGGGGGAPKNALERFQAKRRANAEKMAQRPGDYAANMTFSQSWDTKPQGEVLGSLSMMRVSELCVGTTHRGCRLVGTVAEDPDFIASAAFVLEDIFGDYVEVAVYNVPAEAAMQLYCKGRVLSIAEPYYKIRADGTDGIRVENPAELQETHLPRSAVSWREIGNQFFKSKKVDSATECYARGLRAHPEVPVAMLLSNRALCAAKALRWLLALRCASVATLLDPKNAKANSAGTGSCQDADPEEWGWMPGVVQQNEGLRQGGIEGQMQSPLAERLKAADVLKNRGGEAFKAGKPDVAEEALSLLAPELQEAVATLEGVDLPEVRAEAVALRKRLAASAAARPVAAKSTDEQLREREEASHDGFKLLSNSGDQKVMMQQMMKMLPIKELAKMFGPLAAREVPSFHLDFPKQFGWPVAVDVARASKLLEVTYSIATTSPWMMNHAIKTGDFEFEFEDWQKRFHLGGLGLKRMKLVFEEGRQFRPRDVIDMEFCSQDFKMQYDTRIRNSFANSLNRKEVMQQGTVHVAVGFNDLGALLTGDFRPSTQHDHGPLRFIGYEMNAFNVAKTRIIERLLKDPQVPLTVPLQIWFSSAWTSLAEEAFRRAAAAGMACATPADTEVKAYFSHWISAAPVPLSEARALWLDYHEDGRDWSAIASMARHKDLLTEVGTETGSNIQVAMEALLLRRLQRLRGLLQRGEVMIELHLGMLSLDNEALLSQIAELRPWTMSWSNVLDHMHLREFHGMDRACSINGDTIHYGYSMNWITGVWGTCIMDFPQQMRGELIDLADKSLIEVGHLSFEGLPRSDMLLVAPPHDTPLNYTGFVLSLSHGSKWADYFCSAALGTPVPQLGQASPLSLFCPLHQVSTSISLT
ncbi:RPAP3 [Symbiodinium sp. CCMP2592]|nr:RPAP3 [Symbiodinium sp. CCMP2592]